MKILWAITTCNRFDYLKKTLETWSTTHDAKHDWTLVAADDNSIDGTVDILKKYGFKIIHNQSMGVHYQTNVLLKYSKKLKFDIAFKTDDDLFFKKKGWDNQYILSIEKTGFHHLVFHDMKWMRKKKYRKPIIHDSRLLECHAFWDDTQGAFWTFTPEIVNKVGYFDLNNFGACGFAHRDYTLRCCRAGFNCINNIFDIKNSNDYLELIKEKYQSAPNREKWFFLWNTPSIKKNKENIIKSNFQGVRKIYIDYSNPKTNLNKNLILKFT